MAYEFKTTRRVAFAETDRSGIMHFSNFFLWMEETEHAFLRSVGLPIHGQHHHQTIGWPRVYASCEYTHPLKFEDVVEIQLIVGEICQQSINYLFLFRKCENNVWITAAQGSITAACVAMNREKGTFEATRIPTAILEKIEPAPPEMHKPKKLKKYCEE